jgi:lysophospholipase L1-like esterase
MSNSKIVVAALGDSITAGSPGWDPDPRRRTSDADPESQYGYWVEKADPRLEVRNFGVYGERTDEIARRLDGCVEGAQALIVQGGINDIVQGRSVDDAARNLRGMVRRGRELGLRVAIANVLPWNNGYPAAAAEIQRLNAMLVAIGCGDVVPVLPFHQTLEDKGRRGRMREEWTSDGDHPSVEGYRLLGQRAFTLP